MKYSIQCRYSMVQQNFMFLIRSMESDNQYEFIWLIADIDKPVYVLTNNDIVFKAETEENFVVFSVAESKNNLNEKTMMTKTVPMLTFETDEQALQIVYDYDHLPSKTDKFIGKIIHEFIEVAGGGFLQTTEDYNDLEDGIASVLEEYKKQFCVKNTTTNKSVANKKQTIKTKTPKEKSETTEVVSVQPKEKTEVKTEDIKEKTNNRKRKATTKEENK